MWRGDFFLALSILYFKELGYALLSSRILIVYSLGLYVVLIMARLGAPKPVTTLNNNNNNLGQEKMRAKLHGNGHHKLS